MWVWCSGSWLTHVRASCMDFIITWNKDHWIFTWKMRLRKQMWKEVWSETVLELRSTFTPITGKKRQAWNPNISIHLFWPAARVRYCCIDFSSNVFCKTLFTGSNVFVVWVTTFSACVVCDSGANRASVCKGSSYELSSTGPAKPWGSGINSTIFSVNSGLCLFSCFYAAPRPSADTVDEMSFVSAAP